MAEPIRSAPTAHEPLVLLVEDNEDSRIVYAAMLRHVGYGVAEATDGAQALAIARAMRPSVILMDIAVPVVDGLEATRQLKRDPATACIPVIALTAHALPSDRVRCLEAGCDGYLAKPCEPHTVVEAVRSLLSASPAAPREPGEPGSGP